MTRRRSHMAWRGRAPSRRGARLAGQAGFTLVELLVGLGILGLLMGGMGAAVSQSLRTLSGVRESGQALHDLRRGLGWFSEDVKLAQSTGTLEDGASGPGVTLTWVDAYGGAFTSHSASYALDGDRLVRTHDGQQHTIAARVLSASFSRAGATVTLTAQVKSTFGASRTLSVRSSMRAAG